VFDLFIHWAGSLHNRTTRLVSCSQSHLFGRVQEVRPSGFISTHMHGPGAWRFSTCGCVACQYAYGNCACKFSNARRLQLNPESSNDQDLAGGNGKGFEIWGAPDFWKQS
jgi:hypothetical protein